MQAPSFHLVRGREFFNVSRLPPALVEEGPVAVGFCENMSFADSSSTALHPHFLRSSRGNIPASLSILVIFAHGENLDEIKSFASAAKSARVRCKNSALHPKALNISIVSDSTCERAGDSLSVSDECFLLLVSLTIWPDGPPCFAPYERSRFPQTSGPVCDQESDRASCHLGHACALS